MNRIDWARTGTSLVWIILAAIAVFLYPLLASWVGRKLAAIGDRYYPPALPRDPMKYEGRDLTPEQKRAIEVSDSRWTAAYVRKADSLGFRDDEQNREWEGQPFALDDDEQRRVS